MASAGWLSGGLLAAMTMCFRSTICTARGAHIAVLITADLHTSGCIGRHCLAQQKTVEGRLTGLKALGSSQPQAGLRNTLNCANSSAAPAGSTVPSLSRTSRTTRRLRLLAATGCRRIASCTTAGCLRTGQLAASRDWPAQLLS